jgi:ribosomal protein S14
VSNEQVNDLEVSHVEMSRFTAAQQISNKCKCCGGQMIFNVDDPGQSYALMQMERATPSPFGARVMFLLLTYCENCGHIENYIRKTVTDWLERNPE